MHSQHVPVYLFMSFFTYFISISHHIHYGGFPVFISWCLVISINPPPNVSPCHKLTPCLLCLPAGRDIFVGLSERTNIQGAQAVARAFPEYSTTIIKVHPPATHLKDVISVVGPEVLAVGKSEGAQKTFSVSDLFHNHEAIWGWLFAGYFLE